MVATPILTDPAGEVECNAGRHARQFVGYLDRMPRRLQDHGLDCDRPIVWGCRRTGCEWSQNGHCGRSKTRDCGPCAGRAARRVQEVVARGMASGQSQHMYLLTLTAPGETAHRIGKTGPWCPCTPQSGTDLAEWNPTAAKRWNRLLLDVRRELGARVEFFRAVEVQGRGALHLHVPIESDRPLIVQELRKLAMRAGFGHEIDLQRIAPQSRRQVARYVSKYVTKAIDDRQTVPWNIDHVDTSNGELTRVGAVASYRSWSRSANWSCTMATVRSEMAQLAARLHAQKMTSTCQRPTSVTLVAQPGPGESPPLPS